MPTMPNPEYASIPRIVIGLVVLASILLISRFAKGFLANIAVLMGIVIGGILAAALGMMHFGNIAGAAWFAPIRPMHFGTPIFDPVMILTMLLVMFVTMIRSTGMFLALSDLAFADGG